MKYIALATCLVLVAACKPGTDQLSRSHNRFFNKLLGTWKLDGADFYEVWSQYDCLYHANAYAMEQGRKEPMERIEIKSDGERALYEVNLLTEENFKPVTFTQTSLTATELIFENPDNEFPQRISYRFITHDSLHASISNLEGDKRVLFIYKRVR